MKSILWLSVLAMALTSLTHARAETDSKCYEMRVYYAPQGKLDALNGRFRNHTLKLFEKHGMENIGYWTPVENPDNKLIYILAYPSREARDKAWSAFMADPEWQKAWKESELNGKLVEKVESYFLSATDYSPKIAPSKAGESRVFELRTYIATPGRLDNLNSRFRDHTVKLFSKHGMEHIGYWTPMRDQKGATDTLIYILAHKSKEGAAESFKKFREDSEWVAARKASEEKAGGSLTVSDGVKSVFMVPTDYSPTK